MKYNFITIPILVIIFFFLEIAISFSFRGSEKVISFEDNISFALKLDNEDSDYHSYKGIDSAIKYFLAKNNIKGASVAITRNDSLVYAKGFGIANTETGELVHPGHLFRIASISKLITAVAILKLYEDGEFSLDDHVFGPSGILNDIRYQAYNDKLIEKITIRHLLNHTAGWSNKLGDPLFNSLYIANRMRTKKPADLDVIIEYAMKQKLSHSPGSHYSYSNFGYAVLGKIIEKVSGMTYEDYVYIKILIPLEIKDMHIGKSFYHEKFPNEVMYFEPAGSRKCYAYDGSGKLVHLAYGGNNISLLGAAGGWIASAPELIKFLSAIDGHDGQLDILSRETIKLMTNPYFAGDGLFGWKGTDKNGTWWRTGFIAGSNALVIRQDNGINWVVLLNSSLSKNKSIHNKISRMMFTATYKTKDWPHINLFFDKKQNSPTPIGYIPALNPEL